jgi:hypothetical protein
VRRAGTRPASFPRYSDFVTSTVAVLTKPGFSTYETGCGRETDSLLEGDGFEPSVPGAKEPVFGGESELRVIETGHPTKSCFLYAVPIVRIHLPPAESHVRTGTLDDLAMATLGERPAALS